ncbi:MAG: GntR family transcriptional regulator [Oscillospiraceae bacterium]|nr:GntR family transcriptional regulator [Oscillospiraceae bacterium]
MTWDFAPDRPIYLQLQELMKLNIVSGKYSPGEKLASVRDLSIEASVNPNTMQRALTELERDGLVQAQRTSGRYVTNDMEAIRNMKNELAMELIDSFFSKMNEIGYSKSETIEIISKAKEAGNKDGNS